MNLNNLKLEFITSVIKTKVIEQLLPLLNFLEIELTKLEINNLVNEPHKTYTTKDLSTNINNLQLKIIDLVLKTTEETILKNGIDFFKNQEQSTSSIFEPMSLDQFNSEIDLALADFKNNDTISSENLLEKVKTWS